MEALTVNWLNCYWHLLTQDLKMQQEKNVCIDLVYHAHSETVNMKMMHTIRPGSSSSGAGKHGSWWRNNFPKQKALFSVLYSRIPIQTMSPFLSSFFLCIHFQSALLDLRSTPFLLSSVHEVVPDSPRLHPPHLKDKDWEKDPFNHLKK